MSGDIKAMILAALENAGGEAYLRRQAADENPAAFMTLLGKDPAVAADAQGR